MNPLQPRTLPTVYRPSPTGPPCDLWLDGRAGLAWPPETATPPSAERYPDAGPLESDLARRWGLPTDQVLVTAGADEALDRACRAFLTADRRAVLTDPTFVMLPRYVALSGAELVQVPWPDGSFPAAAMAEALDGRRGLLVAVTPSNPTGLVATSAQLRELAMRCPQALLVVDLAYVEFADRDPTGDLLGLPNVLVVRTLSKAWGLAGARIGYAMGPADVVAALRQAGGPYPTGAAGLAVARERLRTGGAELAGRIARSGRERARLGWLLATTGLSPLPSQANFLLARGPRAPWLADALGGLGIAVRRFGPDATRISLPAAAGPFARLWSGCRAALQPQALLLDIDGVVADVRDSYRQAIRLTAAAFGHPVSAAEVAAAKAQPDSNNDWHVTHRLLEAAGCQVPLARVTARFEQLVQDEELWRRERLIGGRARLADLAGRLPLVAVTGRPRRDLERFLATTDLDGLFAATVCLEDAPAKPSPAPVRLALARVGARRAWLVGDTPDDLAAARAAGVVALGIVAPGDPVDTTRERLTQAGAARVLASLDDLEEILP
ncbi:MAG: aminotransferase class I/II-fold pyridoxal phosphate-dependent enzyme [Candidatus Krumholzibacteriia bacterium]